MAPTPTVLAPLAERLPMLGDLLHEANPNDDMKERLASVAKKKELPTLVELFYQDDIANGRIPTDISSLGAPPEKGLTPPRNTDEASTSHAAAEDVSPATKGNVSFDPATPNKEKRPVPLRPVLKVKQEADPLEKIVRFAVTDLKRLLPNATEEEAEQFLEALTKKPPRLPWRKANDTAEQRLWRAMTALPKNRHLEIAEVYGYDQTTTLVDSAANLLEDLLPRPKRLQEGAQLLLQVKNGAAGLHAAEDSGDEIQPDKTPAQKLRRLMADIPIERHTDVTRTWYRNCWNKMQKESRAREQAAKEQAAALQTAQAALATTTESLDTSAEGGLTLPRNTVEASTSQVARGNVAPRKKERVAFDEEAIKHKQNPPKGVRKLREANEPDLDEQEKLREKQIELAAEKLDKLARSSSARYYPKIAKGVVPKEALKGARSLTKADFADVIAQVQQRQFYDHEDIIRSAVLDLEELLPDASEEEAEQFLNDLMKKAPRLPRSQDDDTPRQALWRKMTALPETRRLDIAEAYAYKQTTSLVHSAAQLLEALLPTTDYRQKASKFLYQVVDGGADVQASEGSRDEIQPETNPAQELRLLMARIPKGRFTDVVSQYWHNLDAKEAEARKQQETALRAQLEAALLADDDSEAEPSTEL
jgi:DNA-directed RNA polymerase subunit H (RpoH/RPB5)